jgi:hypothetical protein
MKTTPTNTWIALEKNYKESFSEDVDAIEFDRIRQ